MNPSFFWEHLSVYVRDCIAVAYREMLVNGESYTFLV